MTKQNFSFPKLTCPLDSTLLADDIHTLKCPHGHCFDKAKQGYINLLPVQFKKSLHPGDNKDMVLARTNFLNAGYYEPIAKQILKIIQPYLQKTTTLIDAGCGEGYYTSYIFNQLTHQYPNSSFSFLGFDISKEAVKQATRRSKNICWAVATNQKIPVSDNSTDILTSLFGFPVLSEFVRILKNNGLFILVTAGQNHLIEIRKQIYQTVYFKKESEIYHQNLKLTEHISIQEEIHNLSVETISNLLKMTPHFYRIPMEQRLKIMQKLPSKITLHINIRCFKVVKE